MGKTQPINIKVLKREQQDKIFERKGFEKGFRSGNQAGYAEGREAGVKSGKENGKSEAGVSIGKKLKSFRFGQRLRFVFFKEDFINELQQ